MADSPHVFSKEMAVRIETMAQMGADQIDIAQTVNLPVDVIDSLYGVWWKRGFHTGNMRLREIGMALALGRKAHYENGKLVREELKPNVTMAIFLHKSRLNMVDVERRQIEVSGPEGRPIQTTQLDLDALNDEEFDLFQKLYAKAKKRQDDVAAQIEAISEISQNGSIKRGRGRPRKTAPEPPAD